MAEEITKPKVEEKKTEELKTTESKTESKEPKAAQKITKKEEAVAKGSNLHISMKHGKYISKFIMGKTIDRAMVDLQDVLKMKRCVPFRGEIPHRPEPGVMAGRYPINASKVIVTILKGLKGNAIANGMDLDNTIITHSSASYASRPSKRSGGRFKRTNIIIRVREAKK